MKLHANKRLGEPGHEWEDNTELDLKEMASKANRAELRGEDSRTYARTHPPPHTHTHKLLGEAFCYRFHFAQRSINIETNLISAIKGSKFLLDTYSFIAFMQL